MRSEESEGGAICGCWRREQSVELGNKGCVPSVRGTEREIQFAGLLEFAPKQEDRFGRWCGGWDRQLDVLSSLSAIRSGSPWCGSARRATGIPHNAPIASTAPNHRGLSGYSSAYRSQTCQMTYQPSIRAASQADEPHFQALSLLLTRCCRRRQRPVLMW